MPCRPMMIGCMNGWNWNKREGAGGVGMGQGAARGTLSQGGGGAQYSWLMDTSYGYVTLYLLQK